METKTLDDLARRLREFAAERDWDQFHSPKNLSMSLAIEAAELMEHFQWTNTVAEAVRIFAGEDKHELDEFACGHVARNDGSDGDGLGAFRAELDANDFR